MSRGTPDTVCSLMFSLTRLSLSMAGFPKTVLLTILIRDDSPYPRVHALWFRLFPFRSPLLRESHVVFSSSGYLDVSVPRVPSAWLCIYHTVTEVCSAGFPHSDICGSMDICSSPQLFAAYHVFLRLSVPRHPPYALSNLTFVFGLGSLKNFFRCIALHLFVCCIFRYCFFSDVLSINHLDYID